MTDKADNAPSQENPHTEDEFDAEMPQDDFVEDAGKDTAEAPPAEDLPRERIAKRIARSGVCSRRDAEQLILDGKVKLNGKRLNTPAVTVTDNDIIIVNDSPLPEKQKPRLWRLFKKRGLVTSHRDEQGRETVFDNLPDHMPRVISVGRLDLNSEGLLLLTNDGELARYLELPSTGWARRYRVRVHGFIDDAKLKQLENGITIDGVNYGSIQAEVDVQKGTNAWMTITLREGKNREIRRVMEHLGWPVTRLMRLSYGPFHLGKMAPGEIDEITGKVMKEQLTGFFNGDSGKADPERDGNRAAKPRPKKVAPARKSADRNKDRYDRPRNDGDDTGTGNYDRPRGGAPRPFDKNRQEQGAGNGPRRGFAGRDDERSQDRNGDFRNDRNDRNDRSARSDKNIHPNRNFRNERKRDDRNTGDARQEGGYRGRNHQGSDAPRGHGRPDDRAEQRDNFRGRRDDRNSRDDRNAGDTRQEGGYRGRNNQGSGAPRGQGRPDDRAEQRDNFRGRRDDRNSRDDRNAGDARQEGGYRGRNNQGNGAPRGQGRPDDRAEQRDNFRGRRDDRNSRDDRDSRNNRDNRDSRDNNRDGRDSNRSFGPGNSRNRDDSRNDGFRNPEQPGGRGGRSGRRDQQNRSDDFADTKRGSGPEARSGRPAGRGKPDARRDRDDGDSQNRDTTNRPTNKGRGRYAGGNAQNNRQSDRQSDRQNDRPTGRSGPRPSGGGNGRRGGR